MHFNDFIRKSHQNVTKLWEAALCCEDLVFMRNILMLWGSLVLQRPYVRRGRSLLLQRRKDLMS